MKASDQDVYIGVSFSDPAFGVSKLNVRMEDKKINTKDLWNQMYDHQNQVTNLNLFKLESVVKKQYKIQSEDPLYIIIISDETTSLEQV